MVQVNCVTEEGGAVELSKKHKVWSSFSVAGVSGLAKSPLLYTGAKLTDGSRVQFFLNIDTGLVVVDHLHKNGKQGVELLRVHL